MNEKFVVVVERLAQLIFDNIASKAPSARDFLSIEDISDSYGIPDRRKRKQTDLPMYVLPPRVKKLRH